MHPLVTQSDLCVYGDLIQGGTLSKKCLGRSEERRVGKEC